MGFFDMIWRLSACRVQSGYTQEQVAEIIGVNPKTVINWENGKTAPNMDQSQKLSELYQIPLAYMDFSKGGNSTPLKERDLSGVTI